jgi:cell division protein FtsW
VVSVALLFSFGLLMIFNTSAAQIMDRSLEISTHAILMKQGIYGVMGIFLGWLIQKWGYQRLLRFSPYCLIAGTFLLALLFVPGIGQTINGARRWLGIFGLSFQPSEWIKIFLPAVYIQWVLSRSSPVCLKSFLKVLGALSVPVVLILLEPDNGTTVILVLVFIVLFVLTRTRSIYWVLPLSVFIFAGGVAAYHMPHVPDRIRIYLHPELDLKGKGHQPYQAKIAAGSGGLWGKGLGESLQKLNYLPEARNDYIAAIFAEEMGFVGILGLISLYICFSYAGFLVALRSADRGGFLLAAMLTVLISIQAFLNLGIVSGLLPSKGMTLPFFSQGGTSLMVNFTILFILLDIARKSKQEIWDVL